MQTARLDLVAQGLLVVSAVLYVMGVGRLGRKGRRWPPLRTVSFLGGLLSVWVAVGSNLASYDDTNATLHVVQHLLLMMVAPPLLVLGRPLVLTAQAGGRRAQQVVARSGRNRLFRFVTHPGPATAVYVGSMYVMLTVRPVYGYLVTHDLVHEASHVWLVAAGLMYFEPLLGATAHRLSHPFKVVAVLAVMPFEAMVGIWLRYQETPLARGLTLSDTRTAGEAFVVGATFVSTVWLCIIVAQWAGRALREERRAVRNEPVDEWTTPWWVVPTEVKGAGGGL